MNPEDVARFPLPGTASPISLSFSPGDTILSYLHAEGAQMTRQLWGVDVNTLAKRQLVISPNDGDTEDNLSLEEKLRRERQRLHSLGVTSYFWSSRGSANAIIMVPLQGNIYVQDGIDTSTLRVVYDKDSPGNGGSGALDPQLSPDGKLVAFVKDREIFPPVDSSVPPSSDPCYLCSICLNSVGCHNQGTPPLPVQVTFGAQSMNVTHGLADFVAQEEMERYRGFWWSLNSKSIAFTEVDERHIPAFRIVHQGKDAVGDLAQEDHRYPFAGKENPKVRLAVIEVDGQGILNGIAKSSASTFNPVWMDIDSGMGVNGGGPGQGAGVGGDGKVGVGVGMEVNSGRDKGGISPKAEIYLARVTWLQDGSLCAQVQNRAQTELHVLKLDSRTGQSITLLVERSAVWINLHHLLRCLPTPVALQRQRQTSGELSGGMDMVLPEGSFSFLWASERTGFMHLYLYLYVAGADSAVEIRQITSGEWVVESLVGVDQAKDVVYVMGTYDSPCERHLYVVPLTDSSRGTTPVRLTQMPCMHNVIMDHRLRRFVDVYSTLEQPAKMVLYSLSENPFNPPAPLQELHFAMDERVVSLRSKLQPPEVISFRTRDMAEELFSAVYRPDVQVHGPGPYPTIVAVYGGPHAQWVSRSWATTVDMRAQRLRDLGFLVLKCDNRGSYRRGLAFEGWLKRCMGGVEISDQEDCVQWAVNQGLADPLRVGLYGWSYGGYVTALCLCKAPNTFKVGVSGAPVTSWDGYDTHYTERYMGTPQDNADGYRESSVLTHASKLQGKLMLVHGLIDENVHFRHTARLINALIAARKPYDLLIFPDERHCPRKLQDRVYMEQQISDYFVQHLMREAPPQQASHL
ncbi:unnamed protein product [Discosporangium mesarthrocarpum]